MTTFRKKLIIHGGIIFAVLVLVGGGFYLIIDKISKISSEILALKNQAHTAQLQIEEFSSLKKDSEKATADLLVIRKAIPLRDDLFVFRTQMEQLARKRNLRSGFLFGSEVAGDEKTLGYANFNMNVEGALVNILSFLKDVENSSYLLQLNRALAKGVGDEASGIIDGKIFFTKESTTNTTQ